MKLTWAAAGKMRNAARPRAAHKRGQAAGSEGSIAASELRSAEHYGNQRLLFQLSVLRLLRCEGTGMTAFVRKLILRSCFQTPIPLDPSGDICVVP